MRTTVDIDEDVLLVTKEIAQREGLSMGKVLSNLVRLALTRQTDSQFRNGVPLFPRKSTGQVVTLDLVNQLRDEVP